MRNFKFPKTPPKTMGSLLAFLAQLLVAVILVFAGFYFVANRMASGEIKLPPVARFVTGEIVDSETAPGLGTSFIEQPVVPEGLMSTWDGTNRVTVLVMGLDFRDWSAGEGPSRTDTMMLLTLDPLNNTAGMLSIPRDLWVSIPGFSNGRINTAYFIGEAYNLPGGGPGMAVKTVEALLGVNINYYAQVDFGAFIRFVDELGGVKVDVPDKIKVDPIVGDPVILRPGRQTLFGELALAYARARNSRGGDLDRALRQQQVILGIRDRLLKPESLTALISKAPALYGEIAGGIQTNLTMDEIIKLAWLAQRIPDKNIQRGAVSAAQVSFATTPDGQSVLIPSPEKIRQLRDSVFLVSTGTLGPLSPGNQQERMAAEAAGIVLLNGSQVPGLASQTQELLVSQGANVVEIADGEFTQNTRIIDYTGNPHTVQFLVDLLGVSAGNIDIQYDPNSPIDVQVILGVDWSVK